ncbi:hypothetical protein PCANC_13806 [Puccinia coronata f. sp. avenae]|uniref:Uncharacterized protein n=1 Tax=Puccinia coronata f. sp. avenae TaxID=200324 RepID=A0A2N5SER6_9BASI|nr:hypothetical protein PCANC_21180 [Puccinia coronata f. sp. avenae]PLW36599.1 hypothetical protein PCASD_11359 [Puccinia coronata f. sp. avenae]PLW44111.1 hypothetical protein PCANC_13806 [Puccinia coronata f. sp. avenae]
MSGNVINTIIISELLAEGEARLRRQIDEYIVRSVRIIGVMQDLLDRHEYERLAAEAIFLRHLAASLGINRVHALCNSIAIQCRSNPMHHEHQQLRCKMGILERQNWRGSQALLQMMAHRTYR